MILPTLFLPVLMGAPAPTEPQAIEALIQAVEKLEGAVFIRNGSEHTPKEAADHLRLKWKNAGSRVKTVPDFIRACGTGSSLSGKPYELRLKDGRTILCSDWLWTEWKRMQSTH
jgi:hypothetical protein